MDQLKTLSVALALSLGAVSLPTAVRAADGAACPVPPVVAPRPANPADEPAWVSARVKELQPNALERKIDRIGWAKDIVEAEKLARDYNRPVFLFTLDGRIDTGRCWSAFAMRAGPLSDDKVIALLNRYYVPVFTANEDYDDDGPASPEGKKAKRRIYLEAVNNKLGSGSVHVYVVKPDGHVLETLGVVNATKEKGRHLLDLLERCAKTLNVAPGEPLVKPKGVSTAPPAPDDALVLHLTARGENTGPQGGSWREFPAENWLVLKPDQWRRFLPPAGADRPKVGTSWEVDKDVAASVLHYFYPQAEDPTDAPRTTIERQSMTATVVEADATSAHARIEGSLTMKRPFYPGRAPDTVEARFVGFVTWDPTTGIIQKLEIVTDKATYQKGKFGVAVRAEPAAKPSVAPKVGE